MSPENHAVPAGGIAACPNCHAPLGLADKEAWCSSGHRFDRAREGFVNLLRPGHGRKSVIGDDAEMVASRRRFLDRGHYRVLSEGLRDLVAELHADDPIGSLLDVGCGEGSFTAAMVDGLGAEPRDPRSLVAFDISRPAVRLAARRVLRAMTAVASVIDQPVLDGSVDLVCSVMAPLHEPEFRRVARPGGRILVVSPGDSHLAELRRVLYPEYRPHDELVSLADGFEVVERRRLVDRAALATRDELAEVWGMTPYRWNTPREGQERLARLDALDVTVHFVATVLQVPGQR